MNADEIAATLREAKLLDFSKYKVSGDPDNFRRFAAGSGLLNGSFTRHHFRTEHRIAGALFHLVRMVHVEHFAQMLTAYICEELLKAKVKFSFETVFSHKSKLAFMERAKAAGHKVYLYFIATESPEINVERVGIRVSNGGHDVPRKKIIDRYERALGQLLSAIDLCYHAFVFDNSKAFVASNDDPLLFAEMKRTPQGLNWAWNTERIPSWFIRHYLVASGDPLYVDVARIALEGRK